MNPTEENNWIALEDFTETLRNEIGLPGLSLGILSNGSIHTTGFGTSSIETGNPVWGETLFQIGSITKTFTAALVMQAVENNLLDLDQPVHAYLPDFKVSDEVVSASVTLRHLLTHSSGWDGDVFLETGAGEDAIHKFVPLLMDREQLSSPGEVFSYNNSGFAILGSILEHSFGLPLEILFRDRIFKPIGMDRAFLNAGEVITEDFALGHNERNGKTEVARPWRLPRVVLPMGGIITSAEDLLKYAECLMNGGRTSSGDPVLTPASILSMWSPGMEIYPADKTSVGLSWMRREIGSTFIVSHSGGTNGQVALLILQPDRHFAVAILTNGEVGRKVAQKVAAFALPTYQGIEMPTPAEIESTAQDMAQYVGKASRPGFELHLAMLGDYLVGLSTTSIGFPTENDPPAPPDAPFRVGRSEEDRLLILEGKYEGVPIDVLRGADGEIRYLRLSSRVYVWSSM